VLLKAGLLFKKTLLASEAGREDVRQARDEWKGLRQPRIRQEIHRLVFLEETGTTTKMTCLRGRARRGARLKADAPFGHWATPTFIAGLRCDGLTTPRTCHLMTGVLLMSLRCCRKKDLTARRQILRASAFRLTLGVRCPPWV
jgi:hypothetical protein